MARLTHLGIVATSWLLAGLLLRQGPNLGEYVVPQRVYLANKRFDTIDVIFGHLKN